MTTETIPQCPYQTCRSKEVNKLAARAGKQLWQCGKCLEGFQTDLPPGEFALNAPTLGLLPDELRSDEPCARGCGERFRFPPEKKRHEAGCPGRTRKETGQMAKEKTVAKLCDCGRPAGHTGRHRGKGSPASAKAAKPKASIPSNGSEKPSAVAAAIDALRLKRAELVAAVPEIQRIDKAISALETIVEGGA